MKQKDKKFLLILSQIGMKDGIKPNPNKRTNYANRTGKGLMYRGYKVRLYPNAQQTILIEKHFGCARWIYNKMIEINQKKYKRTGKNSGAYDLQSYIPRLKKQYPWLKEVSNQALQTAAHDTARAFSNFFRKNAQYPKFKNRDSKKSYSYANDLKLFETHIRIPRLGLIRYRGGDVPEGKIKKITISESAGKYYASMLIKTPNEEPELKQPSEILGLDLGLNNLIVTSHGFEVPAPKYTRKYQAALRKKQKALSRRKKNSNRRAKAKLEVARLRQKICNKRKDHAHKLTRILIEGESQAFAIEDLNVKGMMANHSLAKSIADASWYQFLTFLKYKATAVGKPVLEVGRFFPSSKTCSACGIVKESLALSERNWSCGSCGAKHNRDINAAINIALEAARSAARGDSVIPSVRKVAIYEAYNPV